MSKLFFKRRNGNTHGPIEVTESVAEKLEGVFIETVTLGTEITRAMAIETRGGTIFIPLADDRTPAHLQMETK
tara:strand:+ start:356 stop:574 length:219 start_codon:yes stop_codon:yes gene_type:complete